VTGLSRERRRIAERSIELRDEMIALPQLATFLGGVRRPRQLFIEFPAQARHRNFARFSQAAETSELVGGEAGRRRTQLQQNPAPPVLYYGAAIVGEHQCGIMTQMLSFVSKFPVKNEERVRNSRPRPCAWNLREYFPRPTRSIYKMAVQKSSSASAAAKPAASAAVQIKPAARGGKSVSPAERQRMIAEAAYYIAQKRGFAAGQDVQDWVAAEKKVDAALRQQ
jgi:hypothetical protein